METEKKKPRARRKKSDTLNPAASLLAALKFVAVAQKKAGTVQQQFGMISGNWAAASNGVLTVATKVEEDLTACPHTLQFIEALKKVGEDLSITQLTQNALAVTSGPFRGLVPCVTFDAVPIPAPDSPCGAAGDSLKDALGTCAVLATEGAPNAAYASVLLQSGSCVGTNGRAVVEVWHGIDLPPGILIPKASALAIAKCKKTLTEFGFSESSFTFWFDDGSFIKTQLYNERYPNYASLFEGVQINPWPIQEEFFTAVKAIEAFNNDGIIYIGANGVFSNRLEEEASTYKLEGIAEKMGFQAKFLTSLESCIKRVDFNKERNWLFFFSDDARGVIMGVELKDANDDDIPF